MYDYQTEKPRLFTEDAQKMFLQIRDKALALSRTAGVFRMDKVISGCTGDSWLMLACVDRLVELGELREIPTDGAAQYRVFVWSREM